MKFDDLELWMFFSGGKNGTVPLEYLKEVFFLCSTGSIRHEQFRLFNVREHPDLVKKYSITSMPCFMIKKGNTVKKYKSLLQVVMGILDFTRIDSKNVLYAMAFRWGRNIAKISFGKKIPDKSKLQKSLTTVLLDEGVKNVGRFEYDQQNFRISMTSDLLKKKDPSHKLLLKGYLGGIFTEVFRKGISFNTVKHDPRKGEYVIEARL